MAILVLPLLGLTIQSAIGIGSSLARSVKANRVHDLAGFANKVTGLTDELQKERALSVLYVAGGRKSGADEVAAQQHVVDKAARAFKNAAAGLNVEQRDQKLQKALSIARSDLAKLSSARHGVDTMVAVDKVVAAYTSTIHDLVEILADPAIGSNDDSLVRSVRALNALTQAKEAAALEGALLSAVFSADHFDFDPDQYRAFANTVDQQELWEEEFREAATPAQQHLLDTTVTGPAVQQADSLQHAAFDKTSAPQIGIDPHQWFAANSGKVALLHKVEQSMVADVTAISAGVKAAADRQALLFSIVLTMVLWLAVGLTVLTVRSMIGPLGALRDAADSIADRKLPGVVDRLQRGEPVDTQAEAAAPIEIRSTDEIGQVATAFNAVHRVAITVAAQQAALRKSVSDMFINLARRNQSLIDRQLHLIDDLERDESDPQELSNLFKLDHLATRMRRNAENLIVLSGATPSRRWTEPVPLVEIIRAAVAEVEDYTRVDVLKIDDILLAGQAANDLAHLLAELVENATSFSPPGTKVQIAGEPVSNGYVVEIEDRGLGMSNDELIRANERLANPPEVDFALAKMLGFYVVGRLAARYHIKVQLRHSWYGGITALILLPMGLLSQAEGLELWPATTRGTGPRPSTELVPSAPPSAAGNDLPIFQAARSAWFEDGATGAHLPLRPHAVQRSPNGLAPQQEQSPSPPEPTTTRSRTASVPTPPPTPPPASSPASSVVSQPPASGAQPSAEPAVDLRREEPPAPVTSSGLPRRVPQSNLAAGLAGYRGPEWSDKPGQGDEPAETRGSASRSPDEIRTLLSTYRAGLERGRERGRRAAAVDDEMRLDDLDDDTDPEGFRSQQHDATE